MPRHLLGDQRDARRHRRAARQVDEKAREQREHDGRHTKQHADSRVQRLAGNWISA
ncbi:MAG TPA: hypothetical protein VM819_16440 [Vicinamibacterales bacterium]|nr:hypothetical protein [Vicinamibacterales bacterium]